jgi:hypothetical protein
MTSRNRAIANRFRSERYPVEKPALMERMDHWPVEDWELELAEVSLGYMFANRESWGKRIPHAIQRLRYLRQLRKEQENA